jgi:pyroglutamyl-peptidase
MPRILVSGFEPFGSESVNPSQALVEALREMDFDDVDLHTLILPVVRGAADEQLLAAIDKLLPSYVLMFGEAGGRTAMTPERVAINIDDYRIADNAGHQPRGEPVVAGAPVGYFSTLPIDSMVTAMNAADSPAAVSNSAGTFLCNRVFFRVMHHIIGGAHTTRAGFVHLPYLAEQIQGKPRNTPSIQLGQVVNGAQQIIKVITSAQTAS